MTYEDALERIHGLARFGARLGLSRMERLMELLGNPQGRMKVIHVAGTNGKGSACQYLSQALIEAGYHVGLYTSPYLQRFTERIQLSGAEISGEDLAASTERVFRCIEQMLAEGMESPTEFEAVTAIAFDYYSRKTMDFLVLEVGMGGSGDSTNVVSHPLISLITSVSFDHMDYLGDTLEAIAGEKAGIIKPGVPVVSQVTHPGAKKVIWDQAALLGSTFYDASITPVTIRNTDLEGTTFCTRILNQTYPQVKIRMLGAHQVQNAICALTALEVLLQQGDLKQEDRESLLLGLGQAVNKGRMELIRRDPLVFLDGAHNVAGVQALHETVASLLPRARILLVVGMLRDKEIEEMSVLFLKISHDILVTEPDNPRKLPAEELEALFQQQGASVFAYTKIQDAVSHAERMKKEYDAVIFAGSLYLIGEVRNRYEKQ